LKVRLLATSFVFLLLSGTALATGEKEADSSLADRESDGTAHPFIYNGDPVLNPGWIAAVFADGFYACTGSLVHPEWVLTAGHCADLFGTMEVTVGGDTWFEGEFRTVSAIQMHPGYSPTDPSSVDLALLKLASPVTGVPLAVVAKTPSWPVIGQDVVVAGWGETSTGSDIPDFLQAAGVWVDSDRSGAVDESFCLREWVADSGYDDFCFGGFAWACPGDSGGPIIDYRSPTSNSGPFDMIYGVVSYGDSTSCSSHSVDDVAQSVGGHYGWINGILNPPGDLADEQFFYRASDGAAKYYDMRPSGALGPQLTSSIYSLGWDSITALDLDGNDRDEFFFYRSTDGAAKYYQMRPNGTLATLMSSSIYSLGWDSITALDVDGDKRDEFFFYRSTDGTAKYYRMKPNGTLSTLMSSSIYSLGWDSITALDLDGDGRDEFFFYRSSDGVFKYYKMKPNGTLGALLNSGTFSTGWDSITGIDVDGDGRDEQLFYRSTDGTFKYYKMRPNGSLAASLASGTYSTGWSSITAVNLDGDTAR
jgi:hypothetical protein